MGSTLQIQERFTVDAPVDIVWPFLLDPEQVVVCLPGAQLTEVEGERTFHGNMKVKVGPVTVSYKGTIELTEVDEAEHTIRMEGKGKEKGGAGSAKMSMSVRIEPREGRCEVIVDSDVQLAGKIVRFGRGMIKSVSKQLFKQFSACVQDKMAAEAAKPRPEPAPEPETAESEPAEPEAATASESAAVTASESEPDAGPELTTASEPEPAPNAEPKPAIVRKVEPREVKPVRALPLMFRAIWDGIVGLFARLFRRKRRD